MSAPLGNQYYLNVINKTGRPAIFKSSEELLNACNNYFHKAQNKTICKVDFIKSGDSAGKLVDIPCHVPFTIEALCNHLGVTYKTLRDWENNDNFKDFVPIILHAKEIIRQDQIEGGLIGILNPMLVARIQGLKEQSELSGKIEQTITSIIFQSRTIEDTEVIPDQSQVYLENL